MQANLIFGHNCHHMNALFSIKKVKNKETTNLQQFNQKSLTTLF